MAPLTLAYADQLKIAWSVYLRSGLHMGDPAYGGEDLLHDTLITMGRKPPPEVCNERAYLYQTCRYQARTQRRKWDRRRSFSLGAFPGGATSAVAAEGEREKLMDKTSDEDTIIAAMELREIMRTRVGRIIVARAAGYDDQEIAGIFGMGAAAVVALLETVRWVNGRCVRFCPTCKDTPLETGEVWCAGCRPKGDYREFSGPAKRGRKNPKYLRGAGVS